MVVRRRVTSKQLDEKAAKKVSSEEPLTPWKPHAPLPVLETGLYWTLWISCVLYLFYSTYTRTQEIQDQLQEQDLIDGWSIIGKKKDNSNYEWNFWTVVFKYKLLGALALHTVVGFLVSLINHKLKKFCSPVICLFCLLVELGSIPTLIVLCHCLLSYAIIKLNRPIILWAWQLLFHYTLITEPYRTWQLGQYSQSSLHTDLMQFTSMMSVLRYLSFGMEYHWHCNKKENLNFSLLDLIVYNFYVPLYFNGPLITYENFSGKFDKPFQPSRTQIMAVIWDGVSVIWWYLVLELHSHFFHSLLMIYYEDIFAESNAWVLTGVMYTHLMFFLTKYIIFYRGCGMFAKLDNLDPPKAPKCVSCVYLFTDMWKYFDRGLYIYLKRYIYIPLGGSKQGLLRQLCASFLTFAFIWYWHGGYAVYFVWFLGNWLGVCMESVVGMILKWPSSQRLERKLSPAMSRRIRAVCGIVTVIPLIASNLVFLCGTHPVWAYVKLMFYSGWPLNTLTLIFFMYPVVQCSMESHRLRGTKE